MASIKIPLSAVYAGHKRHGTENDEDTEKYGADCSSGPGALRISDEQLRFNG